MKVKTIMRCHKVSSRKELIMHFEGARRQLIRAKCFEYMGGYGDGLVDWGMPEIQHGTGCNGCGK